jgi:hypothetical protein
MANRFNSITATKIQTLVNGIRTYTGVDFDFRPSPGFRITITVTDDGQTVILETQQPDGQSNAMGAAATPNPPVYNPNTPLQRIPPKVIPATSLPLPERNTSP